MATKPKSNAKAPVKGKASATVRPALKMIEFTEGTVAAATANSGATKTGKLFMVPIENIKVMPGFNVRVTDTEAYKAGIRDLAQSMVSEGFYESQPLGCFPAEIDGEVGMVLISGHRRYEAATLANTMGAEIDKLPVVLKKPGSSDMDLAVSLYKENTGVQPTMLERAVLAHRLIRDGLTEDDVAERLNVSARHIRDLRVIMGAPREVRELIKTDKISASEAVLQLRKDPTGGTILAAAEKAEAAADAKAKKKADKLTAANIEGGTGTKPPREKNTLLRLNFMVTAGTEFLYTDVEPFLPLIEKDETWFKGTKSRNKKLALTDMDIRVEIRRPKTEAELQAETEAADAKAAAAPTKPAKAGKGGGKSSVDNDLDLGGDPDLDADDAPDLRSLGIVGGERGADNDL